MDDDLIDEFENQKHEAAGEDESDSDDSEEPKKPAISASDALKALNLFDAFLEDNLTMEAHRLWLLHHSFKRNIRLQLSSSLMQTKLTFK